MFVQKPSFIICIHDGNEDMQKKELVADMIKKYGVWEEGTSHILKQLLIREFHHPLFLDVGANLGFHALYAAKLTNKVWAVEPQELNLNKVQNNFLDVKSKFGRYMCN